MRGLKVVGANGLCSLLDTQGEPVAARQLAVRLKTAFSLFENHNIMTGVNRTYLLTGVYTVESSRDFSWNSLAYGFILLYHFIVLNFVGRVSEIYFTLFCLLMKYLFSAL
jgi:TMEM164 family